MPVLQNIRHEAFAQGLVEGKPAYQAYLDAGYSCTDQAARTSSSDLLAKPDIMNRVLELAGKASERVAKKIALTKEWVVQEMIQAAQDATKAGQHSARIRAVELLGRETGNFTEQKRIAIRSFDDMTAEEIEAFLAGSPAEAPKKALGGSRAKRTGKPSGRVGGKGQP